MARGWCHIHCSVVGSVVGCRLGMAYFAPHLYHTVPRERKHLGLPVVCVVRVWLGCGATLTVNAKYGAGMDVFTSHLRHSQVQQLTTS